jgi:hypothetical protein
MNRKRWYIFLGVCAIALALGVGALPFPTTPATNALIYGDTYAPDITNAINNLQLTTHNDLAAMASTAGTVQCIGPTDAGGCTVSIPLPLSENGVTYMWVNELAGKNGQSCKYEIGVMCKGDAGTCLAYRASTALEACTYTDAGSDAGGWYPPAIGIDAGNIRVTMRSIQRLSTTLDGGPPINKITYQQVLVP